MKTRKFLQTGIICIILLSAGFSVSYQSLHSNEPLLMFSEGGHFDKEWNHVDSLIDKGLTASALRRVDAILMHARKEVNNAQIAKALIYRIRLNSYLEEDNYVRSIYELQQEADQAVFPLKEILHSIIADIYWRYYQNNRWKFYNRSETVHFNRSDIRTWDLKSLLHAVTLNYELSLKNMDSLQRTSVSILDDILEKHEESRMLRPTLYDFLAHRAADFFINTESGLLQPANRFEIDDEACFSDANQFIQLNPHTKDSMSLSLHAFRILQDLTAFHLHDVDPSALIDVELKRLRFVKNKSVIDLKDSLYIHALRRLYKKYKTRPASAEVAYDLASALNEQADLYNPPENPDHHWDRKKAADICKQAIEEHRGSFGAVNCRKLLAEITSKSIKFDIENVNIPGKKFLTLLSYRNINKVFFRMAKADFETYRKMREKKYDKDWMDYLLKIKPFREWSQELESETDYQLHKAELMNPPADKGFYVMLASCDSLFSLSDNGVAYEAFWCSNISYMIRNMNDGTYDILAMDRSSGKPMKNVSAKLYYQKYNYTLRMYEWKNIGRYVSDENGYIHVPSSKNYRNFFIDFTKGDDRLNTEDSYYQYHNKQDNKPRIRTHFFTDRAVYRPGQTIYFKGIVIEKRGEEHHIKAGFTSKIQFYDVNYQQIADLVLTTNEYGTFSGSFTAPVSSLNGQMHIADKYGSVYFNVEEYKRPKFEVTFNPIQGSFRLNDSVEVSGKAMAYAGFVIDDAKVQYHVVRNAAFPYWGYWRGWHPASPQREIAHGEVSTDATGDFSFKFKALPDRSISKKYRPEYTYTVTADITDINGETHSSMTMIRVGYTALSIDVTLPFQLDQNANDSFKIRTLNLMGQEEPASGTIRLYRLKAPNKTFKARDWSRPDKFTMSKTAFYSAFPDDVFDNENNMAVWERGRKVYDHPFNTQNTQDFFLSKLPEWDPGYYVLEAECKDKYGENVKLIKYIRIFSTSGRLMPFHDAAWFVPLKKEAEPGETVEFMIGSAKKDAMMFYEIELKGKIIHKEWMHLNHEQKRMTIPITEAYRGNVCIHLSMVNSNRVYTFGQVIIVPHSDKKLDMEFETFRSKLSPGQQEEWKIRIRGPKGEKVAAEMLASMYDASLDAFIPHTWNFNIYQSYFSSLYWQVRNAFGAKTSSLYAYEWNDLPDGQTRVYDYLNWFGFDFYGYGGNRYRFAQKSLSGAEPSGEMMIEEDIHAPEPISSGEFKVKRRAENAVKKESGETIATDAMHQMRKSPEPNAVKVRSHFNETAFFFPQLSTDANGDIVIKFTMPEALTKWKFMSIAHTKELETGMLYGEAITQKELMITPNVPRFFREGDQLTLSVKISNITKKKLFGMARISFFDALSMKPVNELFLKKDPPEADFSIKKEQSTGIEWDIRIPEGVEAVICRIVAKAGKYTDGEETFLPVLSNRMLVTESLPMPVRGKQTRTFVFDKLIHSAGSKTLRHHKLTLEFTSNPAWYAIQALPYMMEYPYECSEQTFSRFYANSLASHIAHANPKIKKVFDSWKSASPDALLSNLEKNQELKSLMLEETPWVLDARNENERKKRIGLLFDLNHMSNELEQALHKLEKAQVVNGGWPWFPGMPVSRYITQHILAGFGHLYKLKIKNVREDNRVGNMIEKALLYLDKQIRNDYQTLVNNKVDLKENHLGYTQIQYLYARSFFADFSFAPRHKTAFEYYKNQAKKYWIENNRYMQGMIALALYRFGDRNVADDILSSLRENAIFHEEMGMYWKENKPGYFWYQAPVEMHALMIEAFNEIAHDTKSVNELRIWLLKQKQTQDWKTTRATADACYALLLNGTEWMDTDNTLAIRIGHLSIEPDKMDDVKVEAGTGYFKTSWNKTEIKPDMGKIVISKPGNGIAWGALYWQYFEQMDNITPHKTPLHLDKKLFLVKRTGTGDVLEPVTEKTHLQPGDKIMVRIILRSDRHMEYIHMKDMRASGLEPVQVLSSYKYQDGLGYYESVKDASTNFFIEYLPKGTYVFEYPLRVTHKGDFSNGISSVQCMYAPEFASHSEGTRIQIGR